MAKQLGVTRERTDRPRIELDQENPVAGDEVTFTITHGGANPQVRLELGERVAFGEVEYELEGDGDDVFVLPAGVSTTAVAWLLKKGEPVVGVLFWIAPA